MVRSETCSKGLRDLDRTLGGDIRLVCPLFLRNGHRGVPFYLRLARIPGCVYGPKAGQVEKLVSQTDQLGGGALLQ